MVGAFTCVAAMVATMNHRRGAAEESKSGYSPVGEAKQPQSYGAVVPPSSAQSSYL
jgi:hypothetical protein